MRFKTIHAITAAAQLIQKLLEVRLPSGVVAGLRTRAKL